jgi:NADP-dependent 3-hydroxy acid dehydrogenase YdfG
MSRVVILTGAASGIGRHLAGVLAGLGDRVLATDVNLDALEKAAADERWPAQQVKTHRLDIRARDQWESSLAAALAAFGRVDVLLNVAGYLKPGNCWELDPADVDRHFDINVKGLVHGTSVVGAHFVKQKAGHIVNIGSLASLSATPGLALYSSSKFAVRGFSIACAQELLPHGVAVSLVMPDAVKTPMLDLQVDYPQAAMTFSGAKALTVEDISRVLIDTVFPERPLEVTLPLGRGLLARLADALPGVSVKLTPMFAKKGLKEQERLKQGR